MKTKNFLISLILLLFYGFVIVLMPSFNFYVLFRGFLLPAVLSVFLTILNYKSIKSVLDFLVKILLFTVLGYFFRSLAFYICNGYFDVDFRYLQNDWYLLYILMQIPTILFFSLLTYFIKNHINKDKKWKRAYIIPNF